MRVHDQIAVPVDRHLVAVNGAFAVRALAERVRQALDGLEGPGVARREDSLVLGYGVVDRRVRALGHPGDGHEGGNQFYAADAHGVFLIIGYSSTSGVSVRGRYANPVG